MPPIFPLIRRLMPGLLAGLFAIRIDPGRRLLKTMSRDLFFNGFSMSTQMRY